MSGSGISWATRKSAPRSRQITMPAPNHSYKSVVMKKWRDNLSDVNAFSSSVGT